MITFDCRTVLVLQSSISVRDGSVLNCRANKPNITDHLHSFEAAKLDLNLANIDVEDLIITLKALKLRKLRG